MLELSLMDLVIATSAVLLVMAIVCCLCCICMKVSDLQMKSYIIEMAKRKGVKVDLDQLDPKSGRCRSPTINDNCTIFVPEVGIIL